MRIVIASRQPVTRSAIKRFLQIKLGLDRISEAATLTELMVQIASGDVDLVVLDAGIEDQSPAQVVRNLKKMSAPPTVFVLDGKSDAKQISLDAGADAFLYKGDPPTTLLVAVETIRQTKNTIDGGYHDNFQNNTDR